MAPRTSVAVHLIYTDKKLDDLDVDDFQREMDRFPGRMDIALPGDLVVDKPNAGYRMDAVCMIGLDKKVIDLEYDIDEYGAIPRCFTTPDKFTPDAILGREDPFRWHNRFVPVDLSKFEFGDAPAIVDAVNEGDFVKGKAIIATYGEHRYALVKIEGDSTEFVGRRDTIYMEFGIKEHWTISAPVDYVLYLAE